MAGIFNKIIKPFTITLWVDNILIILVSIFYIIDTIVYVIKNIKGI